MSLLLVGMVGLENVTDTLCVNFMDTFAGHMSDPSEARWRTMGEIFIRYLEN